MDNVGNGNPVFGNFIGVILALERRHLQRNDIVAAVGIEQARPRVGLEALQTPQQQVIRIGCLDARTVAGEEEEDIVAFVDRLQERLKLLVEFVPRPHIDRERDVLLVESDLLKIGGNIGGVIICARQILNVRIAVTLNAEYECATRLRLRARRRKQNQRSHKCQRGENPGRSHLHAFQTPHAAPAAVCASCLTAQGSGGR